MRAAERFNSRSVRGGMILLDQWPGEKRLWYKELAGFIRWYRVTIGPPWKLELLIN
jgi:hypothetical protein